MASAALAALSAAFSLVEKQAKKKTPPTKLGAAHGAFDATKHPRGQGGKFAQTPDAAKPASKVELTHAPPGSGGLTHATVAVIGPKRTKKVLAAKTGGPAKAYAAILQKKAGESVGQVKAHYLAASAELHAFGEAKHAAWKEAKAKAKAAGAPPAAAKKKVAKPATPKQATPKQANKPDAGANLVTKPEHEITKEEANAIRRYQNGSYSSINAFLFGKSKVPLGTDDTETIKHLDRVMAKSIITKDQPTFRGIRGVKRYTGLTGFGVGAEISLGGGFLSTSKSYSQAVKFAHSHSANKGDKAAVLIIRNKKGQTGIDVNQRLGANSGYASERELILPRDLRVRVIAIRLAPDDKDKYKFPHIIVERLD